MATSLHELFESIANQATLFEEPVLAHLCRMAALEAGESAIPMRAPTSQIIGIWDWDVVNDLDHLDPNCARLFGVPVDKAAKGMPINSYLQAVHPDDQAQLGSKITAALKGGVFEAEYRVVSERRVRWVYARGYCTLDKSNRPERFPGAITGLDS